MLRKEAGVVEMCKTAMVVKKQENKSLVFLLFFNYMLLVLVFNQFMIFVETKWKRLE